MRTCFWSAVKSCPTLCNSVNCNTPLSFTVSPSLLKFMSFEPMMLSNHLILCCLLSSRPQSSQHQGFIQWVIRWPKYGSFRFSMSPSNEYSGMGGSVVEFSPANEYSGLVSFRTEWFDLFAIQETLKSFLHTIVRKHQFFCTQLLLLSNIHILTWLLEKS